MSYLSGFFRHTFTFLISVTVLPAKEFRGSTEDDYHRSSRAARGMSSTQSSQTSVVVLCEDSCIPPWPYSLSHSLSLKMNSSSTASVILQQLEAALRLVETLSSSLTPLEIVAVRQNLLEAYVSMGQALASRNLEAEGITTIGESYNHSPDCPFTQVKNRSFRHAYYRNRQQQCTWASPRKGNDHSWASPRKGNDHSWTSPSLYCQPRSCQSPRCHQ